MKTIYRFFGITTFAILIPFICMEMMIKKKNDLASEIRVSFQLMLFVIDFGSRK